MKRTVSIVFCLVGGLLLFGGVGFWLGLGYSTPDNGSVTVRTVSDTVVLRDTIVATPKQITKTVIRTDTVKLLLANYEDSVDVLAPIDHVVATDDSTYFFAATGIGVEVDSVGVIAKTRTINTIKYETKIEQRSRWGIGITAGLGVNVQGKFSPQLTVGVTYNIFQFRKRGI